MAGKEGDARAQRGKRKEGGECGGHLGLSRYIPRAIAHWVGREAKYVALKVESRHKRKWILRGDGNGLQKVEAQPKKLGVRPDIEVKAAGGKTAVFCPLSQVHRYIQLV